MRYLIGIDAAKAKCDVAILNSDFVIIKKPFRVPLIMSDIKAMVNDIKSLDGDIRAVIESTGRYHLPITEQLNKAGIFITVVNPKLIKGFGDNTLRHVKTDAADAKKSAGMVYRTGIP